VRQRLDLRAATALLALLGVSASAQRTRRANPNSASIDSLLLEGPSASACHFTVTNRGFLPIDSLTLGIGGLAALFGRQQPGVASASAFVPEGARSPLGLPIEFSQPAPEGWSASVASGPAPLLVEWKSNTPAAAILPGATLAFDLYLRRGAQGVRCEGLPLRTHEVVLPPAPGPALAGKLLTAPQPTLSLTLTNFRCLRGPGGAQEFEASVVLRNVGDRSTTVVVGGTTGDRAIPSNLLLLAADESGDETLLGPREWPDVGGNLDAPLFPQGSVSVPAAWRASRVLPPGAYTFRAVLTKAPIDKPRGLLTGSRRPLERWQGRAESAPVSCNVPCPGATPPSPACAAS
jgi:hypothetical protein